MSFGPIPSRLILPSWVRWGVVVATVGHDVAFLVAAYYGLQYTPPNLETTLGPAGLVNAWALTLGLGAVLGLAGAFWHSLSVELVGCTLMAGGLLTMSLAVFTAPLAGINSFAFAAVLMSGLFALALRALRILAGAMIRVQE